MPVLAKVKIRVGRCAILPFLGPRRCALYPERPRVSPVGADAGRRRCRLQPALEPYPLKWRSYSSPPRKQRESGVHDRGFRFSSVRLYLIGAGINAVLPSTGALCAPARHEAIFCVPSMGHPDLGPTRPRALRSAPEGSLARRANGLAVDGRTAQMQPSRRTLSDFVARSFAGTTDNGSKRCDLRRPCSNQSGRKPRPVVPNCRGRLRARVRRKSDELACLKRRRLPSRP